MAKIKAVDQAVVITSSLTNEQLSRAVKYFPEALILKRKNEEGKNVPVFAIGQGSELNPVTKSGISFPNGEKNEQASVTLTIPKLSKAKRTEYIKDNYGKILMNLTELEKAYEEKDKAFTKEYAELDKNIDIE